jgi:hypothetical protein
MSFGKLKKLNLRDIWQNEATEFTPWLAKNINELSEALGMQLELKQREASVGDFSLDLLAFDLGTSRTVVIENQITQTDHDHLGKLMTYASGYDASVIVWIAESFREEHRQALEWLNQITDAGAEFFGVVIEVLQIDESKPAYNFNPIVFPNEWRKNKKVTTSELSPKMEAYQNYFQLLIDELRDKHKFTNARKGQPQSFYSFASGYSGITYGINFAQGNRARVELYIGLNQTESNKKIFDLLMNDKEEIEKECGNDLEWERLEDRQSSRIALYRNGSIDDNEKTLQEIRDWSILNVIKFKKVFGNRLKKVLTQLNNK